LAHFLPAAYPSTAPARHACCVPSEIAGEKWPRHRFVASLAMDELEISTRREAHRSAVLPTRGLSPKYQRTHSNGAFPTLAQSVSPKRLTSPNKLGVGYSTRESRPPTIPGSLESPERTRPQSPLRGSRYEPGEKMHVFQPKARTRASTLQENMRLAVQSNDLQDLLNVYSAALDLDAVGKNDILLADRYDMDKVKKRIRGIFRKRILDNMKDNGLTELKRVLEEIEKDCLLATLSNFTEFLQAKAFIQLKEACKAVQAIADAFENGRGVGVIPNRVQKQKLQALKDALIRAKRLQLPSAHIDVARDLVQQEKARMGDSEPDIGKRQSPLQHKRTFPNMDLAVDAAAKDGDLEQLRQVVKAAQDMGLEGDALHSAEDALHGYDDIEGELENSRNSLDEEELQELVDKAEAVGLSCAALETVKERLKRLQHVRESLVRGVRDEDATMVANALKEAEEMGMQGDFVGDAKHFMKSRGGSEVAKDLQARLTERLQLAIESRRLSHLREAIAYGKEHGAPMIEIFKAERVLAEEQEFCEAVQADIDAILEECPIEFANGKETLCKQDRTAVHRIARLLGTLPEDMSFTVHVHHNCSPAHVKGMTCSADNRSLTGNRARNLKSALCSASERTNIIAQGWGCQHPEVGLKKCVRIMPTELEC